MYEYEAVGDKSQPAPNIDGITLTNAVHLIHKGAVSETVWQARMERSQGDDDEMLPADDVIIKSHKIDYDLVKSQIADWESYRSAIDAHKDITGIETAHSITHQYDLSRIYFVDKLADNPDVQSILADPSYDHDYKIQLAAKLFQALTRIPAGADHQAVFMIDGKASNFCPNDDGSFTYVDTFPPLVRDGNGLIQRGAYDAPEIDKRSLYTDTFIHGDIYGILGRFWGVLRKDNPELWSEVPGHPAVWKVVDDIQREDLRLYSQHLLESDTAFIQTVYRYGEADNMDSRLYNLLNGEADRVSRDDLED